MKLVVIAVLFFFLVVVFDTIAAKRLAHRECYNIPPTPYKDGRVYCRQVYPDERR